MTQTLRSLHEYSGTNWQLLGELELPASPTANDQTRAWLQETLQPLHLNERFLNKILESARSAGQDSETIHLLIFVPLKISTQGKTWGFFRIDKTEDGQAGNQPPRRATAFYLYLEGS